MSRLSSKRNCGPITSTQIDGENSNGSDEYLSREERVFKRQLELAIEQSKKSAPETIGSSSENSQPVPNDNEKKRKIEDLPTPKSKSRKMSDSDDDFNMDFESDFKPKQLDKVEICGDSDDSFKIIDGPAPISKGPDESTDTEFDVDKLKSLVQSAGMKKVKKSVLDSSDDEDFEVKTSATKKNNPKTVKKSTLDSSDDDDDFLKTNEKSKVSKINSFYSDEEFVPSLTAKEKKSQKTQKTQKTQKVTPKMTQKSQKKTQKKYLVSDDDDDDFNIKTDKKKLVKKKAKMDADSDGDFSPKQARKSKVQEETIELSDDDEDFSPKPVVKKVQPKKELPSKVEKTVKKETPKIDDRQPKSDSPSVVVQKLKNTKIDTPKPEQKIETPKIAKKVEPVVEPKVEKKENTKPFSSPGPVLGVPKPKVFSMPKWTPPARVGTLKKDTPSPIGRMNLSPGFRVGLSRNVKVKPLHPNVKMT